MPRQWHSPLCQFPRSERLYCTAEFSDIGLCRAVWLTENLGSLGFLLAPSVHKKPDSLSCSHDPRFFLPQKTQKPEPRRNFWNHTVLASTNAQNAPGY